MPTAFRSFICFMIFAIGYLSLVDHSLAQVVEPSNPNERTWPRVINGTRPPWKPWSAVVGQRVRVEGIAWHTGKGVGECILLDGATIYCPALNFQAPAPNDALGRLVRVTGVLKRVVIPKAPPGAQGYAQDFVYYEITHPQAEIIEKVDWPWLEEL